MSVKEEKEYWDNAAQDPDVNKKYICDIDLEKCLTAITSDLKTGKILEIGCGVGRLTSWLATSSKFGGSYIHGIDISEKMVRLAKENTPWKTYTTYSVNDGRTIPYSDGFFDSVYSMLVFQHIPNDAKENYIKEAARVLSQGGVLRIQFVKNCEDGPVSYSATADQIATMCEYAGFTIDKIEDGLLHPQWVWITATKT